MSDENSLDNRLLENLYPVLIRYAEGYYRILAVNESTTRNKIYRIYALLDPRLEMPHAVRYIGMTTQQIKTRLYGHYHDKTNPAKRAWLMELKELGTKPILEEIEIVAPEDNPFEREEHWQRQFIEGWGVDLLNIRIGRTLSPEHRKAISMALKGNRHALGNKSGTGKKLSEAHRQAIARAWRFRAPPSDETRAKTSASLKSYFETDEGKAQAKRVGEYLRELHLKRVIEG